MRDLRIGGSSSTLPLLTLGLAVALVLRLWDLELRPLHHDEGVNGWFLKTLFEDNVYRYDPANYHGPFFYYIGLIPFYLVGVSTFSLRFMPALFGSLIVILLAPLRRRMGWSGIISSGFLLAVSPSSTFYSRYAIHETYLIFFTLALVVCGEAFLRTKKSAYFYAIAASMAFIVSIKETYIITFGVLGISLTLSWVTHLVLHWKRQKNLNLVESKQAIMGAVSSICRALKERKRAILGSTAVFLAVNVFFYSSIFTNLQGLKGIISTLAIWTSTGVGDSGHNKPFLYYLSLLLRYDLSTLLLGIVGLYYCLRKSDVFTLFICMWFSGMFFAYSLIPYKTPWLILNLTLPLAILAGNFIKVVTDSLSSRFGFAVFILLLSSVLANSCYHAADLSFRHYDDESQDLVYVHTFRDIYNLVDRIDTVSRFAEGKHTAIEVLAPTPWPLQWYLRKYTQMAYWEKIIDSPNAPFIICSEMDLDILKPRLKEAYHQETYRLRPGVNLVFLVRKQMWDRWFLDSLTGPKKPTNSSKSAIRSGITGKYYRGRGFDGEPFMIRIEKDLNLKWISRDARPVKGPFSVEWEGYLFVSQAGNYCFNSVSNEGCQVFIDEFLVMDSGKPLSASNVELTEGNHSIKIRWHDSGGEAVMRLLWNRPGLSESLIPGGLLNSFIDEQPVEILERNLLGGLKGRYSRTTDSMEEIHLNRIDRTLNYSWTREEDKPMGSPFSIQWSGFLLVPAKGLYTLITESDDGSWVYIDGNLVVDNGDKHAVRRAMGDVNLTRGYHPITIRYFDAGGGAVFRFLWKPPNKSEEPVPESSIFHLPHN